MSSSPVILVTKTPSGTVATEDLETSKVVKGLVVLIPTWALTITPKAVSYTHLFCAGEMIDWEAPTGGYLLQACFSTGFFVGKSIAGSQNL